MLISECYVDRCSCYRTYCRKVRVKTSVSTLWRHVGGRSSALFILHLGTRYRPLCGSERTPIHIGPQKRSGLYG